MRWFKRNDKPQLTGDDAFIDLVRRKAKHGWYYSLLYGGRPYIAVNFEHRRTRSLLTYQPAAAKLRVRAGGTTRTIDLTEGIGAELHFDLHQRFLQLEAAYKAFNPDADVFVKSVA